MTTAHQPVQARYVRAMRKMARTIDRAFNARGKRTTGFCLLVFPFGDDAGSNRMNYISNAERTEMIVAMKELIARFEGRVQDTDTVQ